MGLPGEKRVHLRLGEGHHSIQEVLGLVRRLQEEHPEWDVFFDGDEKAICSRPRARAQGTGTPTPPPDLQGSERGPQQP